MEGFGKTGTSFHISLPLSVRVSFCFFGTLVVMSKIVAKSISLKSSSSRWNTF